MSQPHIPILVHSDARRLLVKDRSVQCVITSPPYWQMRKYDGPQDGIWGGSQDCEHQWSEERKIKQSPQRDHAKGGGFAATRGTEAARKGMAFEASEGRRCSICKAWQGNYGFEPTVEMYVAHTVEIMRELRRVLRDDGLLFWNIADTYRNKRLACVPQRVAIAAVEDGWVLRNTIVWAKRNPMPESVQDRLTRSHELILLLSKSDSYNWSREAAREPAISKDAGADCKRNMRDVWTIPLQPFKGKHFAPFPEELARRCISIGSKPGDWILDCFAGSGTVGQVAMQMGRRCVLADINYTGDGYDNLARERFQDVLQMKVEGSRPLYMEDWRVAASL